jgi:hypothetical protein
MDKHCFVIPAFKESPYLEECVQHLLKQTIKSRIIITTSTPNSFIENIAKKYKLDYFINLNQMRGMASDWNFALSKVHSELATIAHQDDIYEASYAEKVIAKFDSLKQDNVLMAFTQYKELVNGVERKTSLNAVVKNILMFPFLFNEKIKSNFLKKALLAFGDPIGCPTVTLNMKLLTDFSFSENYNCILDWVAWYHLAGREGSFVYIKKPLMQHRIHFDSETTHQINIGKRKEEEEAFFTLIWGKYISKFFISIYTLGHKQNKI